MNTNTLIEPGDELSRRVIGAAIEVHKRLGPGLLESTYRQCLGAELRHLGIAYELEVPLPVRYRNEFLDCGYKMDVVVEKRLIIEIKACTKLEPVFEAQLLTYMRLSGIPLGLIINFHVTVLRDGIVRRVLSPVAPPLASSAPLR